MDFQKILLEMKNSVMAGISIGLGGIVFLQCENRLLGAFLFSVGLLAVLVFGFDLYTGKVCYIEQYKTPQKLAKIWLGNFIGASAMALLMFTHTQTVEKAAALAASKAEKPLLNVFADAVICGICIAIAVKGYRKAEGAGKYLAVVLGVMVFILAGAEHVVADMFYLILGRSMPFGHFVLFLLVCTAGNTLGGLLFAKQPVE